MSEHTPGPWEYDGGAVVVQRARPHMRICFLPSDHHEYASSKPDARLIAAAPDMYEALRDLVSAVTAEVNEKGGGGYILARLTDARAAIAKAEGKPADDDGRE